MKIMNEIVFPAYSLWMRELIRFFRQRTRMIGVIGSPILFWFFIGSGLGTSFKTTSPLGGANYLEYFYPGTLLLIMLFTAIFSTISIIEDRNEGFLQSVLVAPVSSASIVLGKILGGTTLAVIQAIIFLALAPLVGFSFTLFQFVSLVVLLIFVGFGLTGLGFLIAWRMESTQGFHAIMNLFLIPLWLLSGSLFPMEGAPAWLRYVMAVNPLTYSISATRVMLYHRVHSQESDFILSVVVIFVFCAVVFLGSMLSVRKKS